MHLIKVYNKTPAAVFRSTREPKFYPVTLAISTIQNIIKIGDVLASQSSGEGKNDLRSKLVRNDGLKHIFGVRVVDPKCSDPDVFNSGTRKLASAASQQAESRMILNFINVLS